MMSIQLALFMQVEKIKTAQVLDQEAAASQYLRNKAKVTAHSL